MRVRAAAGWAAVALLLAGCSIGGGLGRPGSSEFPLPGPLPPVGTEWTTDDGSAGLRLGPDGMADVWGLPWYRTTPGSCEEADLEYVSETGTVSTVVNPNSSTLNVTFVVSDTEVGLVEDARTFWRSNDFEGWQVLTYSSCILFNDGHNLVFHMVGQ